MRDKKKSLNLYLLYDRQGIKRHLEEMAEKGWMLEKTPSHFWTYRKIEPRKITFEVVYYQKATSFDPEPSEEQKEFIAFCEQTGWKFVSSWAQMQFFYNEQQNPIPLDTDPVMEIEAIHKTMRKGFLPVYWWLVILALFGCMSGLLSMINHPINFWGNFIHCFTLATWVMCLAFYITEILAYNSWRRRARSAAQHGEFLASANTAKKQKIKGAILLAWVCIGIGHWAFSGNILYQLIGVGSVLCMLLLILGVQGTKAYLKKKKVSARKNLVITLLVDVVLAVLLYGTFLFLVIKFSIQFASTKQAVDVERVALYIQDLLPTGYEEYGVDGVKHEESIFLVHDTVYQYAWDEETDEEWYFDYETVQVKVPLIYEMCKKEMLSHVDNEAWAYAQIGAEEWQARAVYQAVSLQYGSWPMYLICYDDRMVEVVLDWEPDKEQQAYIVEKLAR